ncbi:hypothetical protein GCM10023085_44840 [Actinomadura viridis]|uniref:DUF2637 domain-containing protein n=1 Tax=Actinomadura viridis TaxID=58110 RepID=A0A931DLN0_9ACTN|nr:hypothetical protein [Actinomadura viridis]MBG6089846.1 hypothetical protein [Actinomadura viridis]
MIPDLNFPSWFTGPIPYLATGGAVLGTCLVSVIVMAYRGRHAAPRPLKAKKQEGTKEKGTLENKLTFLVALIIAGVCAQGMGKFFKDKLDFPLELVIVVGGVLELTAFTCALRARRNVRDPNIGKAGIDGIAVWVVTALSGAFAAMDADTFEVALFRLIMPLLAAWLWERGMAIERRRVRGRSAIHWRVTPERVLVWLRIAEPTGRTASEVDAHRRLTRVAKAAKKVRRLRNTGAFAWRVERAEARLERAMGSAVAHAGLASDPVRQRNLIAQIGSLYNATQLADLTPDAPWAEFSSPAQRTWFEAQGLSFMPAQSLPQVQVRAEVEPPAQWALSGPSISADNGSAKQVSGPVSDLPDQVRVSVADRSVNGSRTQVSDWSGNGSETGPESGSTQASRTQVSDRSARQVPDPQVREVSDPKASPAADRSPDQVPDPAKQTRPRRRRTRSKTRKPIERLDEAIAADKAYLADHGRHIPAEKLAKALSIGKPAALELVKQVRGGHIDLAK